MGNTLTACTSANTADRIPKNNAPTEKPSSNDTQGDVNTTAEGSTFVKNINIRKSLRAARKSVSKPFKKMKNRGKDGAQEGEDVATVAAVDVVVADAPKDEVKNEASATIEVETHTNEQDSKEVVVESKDVEASEAESSNVAPQLNSTTEECQVEAAVYEDRQDADGKDDQVSQPEETDGSQTSTGNQEQLQPEEIKDGQETTIEIPEVNVTKVAEDAEDAGDAKEVIEQDSTDGEDKERGKRRAINEALFNKYDKDGSGLLKKSEIKRLLKNDLGLDREEASMMQLLIHEDESHELSLDEFQVINSIFLLWILNCFKIVQSH